MKYIVSCCVRFLCSSRLRETEEEGELDLGASAPARVLLPHIHGLMTHIGQIPIIDITPRTPYQT